MVIVVCISKKFGHDLLYENADSNTCVHLDDIVYLLCIDLDRTMMVSNENSVAKTFRKCTSYDVLIVYDDTLQEIYRQLVTTETIL